jgi:hypothetical protein
MKHLHQHQQRVVDERAELSEKLDRLRQFVGTSPQFRTLPVDERQRLERQAAAMDLYDSILQQRIAAF